MNIMKAIGEFNIKHANHRSESSAARRVSTVISEKSSFLVREAYNAARTNVIYSLGAERGCKKVLITSASPHEGKTTTCLNLAITFAQTEAKVLIIDADLRKPRIYRHLMIERENGLSDLLCGLIDIDTAIKHCEAQNIDCITSGQIPPNPTELLSSSEMGRLLDTLSERYDYIFIDTPPVTVVTEAAAMSKYASGVIFVIRQNSTIHESIKQARNNMEMANAKILGFILNDVTPSAYSYGKGYSRYSYRRSYKYYGGYGYGYGYGKGYGYYGGYGYGGYGYGYGYKDKKHSKSKEAEENTVEKKPTLKELLAKNKKKKAENQENLKSKEETKQKAKEEKKKNKK